MTSAPTPAADPALDAEALLENLRLHQQELQIQNEELRRAQIEAREAQRYFVQLFDQLPLVALVVDEHGLIQQANQRAFEVFGFRSQLTLRNHAVYRLLDAASATRLATALHDASALSVPQALGRLRVRSGSGALLEMEAHIGRWHDPVTEQHRHVILMIDRSAEHALAEQSRLYETIIEHASAKVYAFDLRGVCLLANQALLKLLGMPRHEVLGHTRAKWLFDVREFKRHDAEVLASGQPKVFEEVLRLPGKATRFYVSEKFPLRDANGTVVGLGGISTDVTEIRHMSRQLALALAVFEQGSEGILITDGQQRITFVNGAFQEITGYRSEEVLGKCPKLLSSGRHGPAFYEALWKQLRETGRWQGEIWDRRKSGEIYPAWLSITAVQLGTDGDWAYVAVFSDITQRKAAQEQIERLAFFDVLTGLPNRYLLKDRVQQLLRHAARNPLRFALVFLDLDHFKEVNDILGHEAGDQLLQQAVQRMQAQIRDTDTLARLAGDEFVWLAQDMAAHDIASRLTAILRSVSDPYTIDGQSVQISVSAGVALYPDDGQDYESLLKHADMAMYEAKSGGRNAFRFFNPAMASELQRKYRLELLLRNAIEREELEVWFQPQFALDSGQIVGVEALLRWNSAELGRVDPDEFIAVAEERALVKRIDGWVLEQACAQWAEWREQGLPSLDLAVNLSARTFWSDELVEDVQAALEQHRIPPQVLELELTERLAMQDAPKAIDKMRALKAVGVRLSIDDFGTGFSSLAYLRWMPVDTLKIDKSFVDDIGRDRDDEVLCRSIVDLARSLGLTTLAEGVETAQQAAFLRDIGCRLAQGFWVAAPMSGSALSTWLPRYQQGLAQQTAPQPVPGVPIGDTSTSPPTPQTATAPLQAR